ncbi:MAG: hypothetical protein MZV63_08580 [Marinilabiliales bacterium]|nr:hypothetical protein [Marinilabiliales bacterium]
MKVMFTGLPSALRASAKLSMSVIRPDTLRYTAISTSFRPDIEEYVKMRQYEQKSFSVSLYPASEISSG